MTPCPAPERLDRWLNEQLPTSEAEAIAAHVESCPGCQATLETLTRPTKLSGPPRHSTDDQPTATEFVDRLKALGPTTVTRHGETIARSEIVPDSSGGRVGGYEILGELGRGGMGVVYKARQPGINRVVALKMIRHGFTASAEEVSRFRREAEVLGRLQHPGIVQVYEVGESEGRPFLVMEYVAGGSLSLSLARGEWSPGRPDGPRRAAAMVEALALAVDYAHRQGVLHRDLKPGNILLAGDGGLHTADGKSRIAPPSPKITDFGLARPLAGGASLTYSGQIVGTPEYMAPEQVSGRTRPGPGVDIHALGAILYELLTGRPPFAGTTTEEVLLQVAHEEPVSPSRLRPGLPRDLATICLHCLEKDPRRRYPTADALAGDLRRFLDGQPVLARPPGKLERAWKWARRRPTAAALLTVMVLLAVVGFPGVTALWLRADAERQRADREQGRARAALEETETALYHSRLTGAEHSYRLDDIVGAQRQLALCEPPEGEPDRRGWEWHYLNRLTHAELRDFRGPGPTDDRARAVYTLAFSRDGRRLAAGGGVLAFIQYSGLEPGGLAVWDIESGERLADRSAPEMRGVSGAAFHHDGRLFCAEGDMRLGREASLTIWPADLTAPRHRRALRTSGEVVPRERPGVAVSPDGRLVACRDLAGVRVFDATTEDVIAELPGNGGFGFTTDGRLLVSEISGQETRVRVWDSQARKLAGTLSAPTGRSQVFAPDGRTAAILGPVGELLLCPLDDTSFRAVPLRGWGGETLCAAFSPDGRTLATGGADGAVRLWDVRTRAQTFVFRGHADRVLALAFNPAGNRLASAGWDGTVKVWDPVHDPEYVRLTCPRSPIKAGPRVDALAFGPGGELVAVRVPGGDILRWNPKTGDPAAAGPVVEVPPEVNAPGQVAAISSNGRRVAAVTADRRHVKVWACDSGKQISHLGGQLRITLVYLDESGEHVATAGWERRGEDVATEIRVWETAGGTRLFARDETGRTPTRLALSPDGRRLAVSWIPGPPSIGGAPAGTASLSVWDIDSQAPLHSEERGPDEIRALAFSRGGNLLAAADVGNTIRIWDVDSPGTPRLFAASSLFYELAFSPDNRRLAAATRDHVAILDLNSGRELLRLRGTPRGGLDRPFNPRLAFSPDGLRLAAGQRNFTIAVWSAESPQHPR